METVEHRVNIAPLTNKYFSILFSMIRLEEAYFAKVAAIVANERRVRSA